MVIIDNIEDFRKKFNNKFYGGKGNKARDVKIKKKYPLENETLETITFKEALQLVEKLESDKCEGCGDKMLFCDSEPYCVYQASFDRIDNKKIHSFNNLKIVCWNCNSSGYGSIKLSCSKRCHINSNTEEEREERNMKLKYATSPWRAKL